ncbi:hypothetical protein L1047_12555 [Synechococcus sp. Nb3U1]|uniref:hypothetical protein n=1 Tax=Synechococcus sp. Nb3U1 TaxID=1914529 RepID=UPI001F39DB78|nr:hypothetical protein [Synechococcus sp. Nb3U1]MCF2972026.1 hypothetical protein [Synechococcus sp. Nb3U1]
MENSLVRLDYRVYRLARLLSEHLELSGLVSVSAGSLNETEATEAAAPTEPALIWSISA